MCGLAGFFDPERRIDPAVYAEIAARMAGRLAHRGPDDEAVWIDPAAGVALGFRRLSIIDLSPAGRQPMLSARGGLVMAYNGEIYNFRALREELPGTPWRGHSDSEVLLAAIERRGFAEALPRLDGMFAIALWDKGARRLCLARDRFGEKPLYYGWVGGVFVFASELKALAAHPLWTGDFDRAALALFLRRSYVPAPYSAYAGIKKLPPGHHLSVSAADQAAAAQPYWSAAEVARTAAERPFAGGLDAAAERLQALLDEAVSSRLEADVPLGAFLSGGIDSSTVAAAMQRARPGSVRTFSIGFAERAHDESGHAARVAQHLETTHTSFTVTDAECREVLPRLAEVWDEPFADASQIPTLLLCRLTRSAVKVSLSGDGGDELFGGYGRYAAAARRWRRTERAPPACRAAARRLARPLAGSNTRPWRRLRKLLEPWGHESAGALYGDYLSRWRDGDGLTPGLGPARDEFAAPLLAALPSLEQAFMLIDATSYLPDDLLVKIDRASMAFGLEARAPLLDPRIAEFAWSLPASLAVAGGPKLLLREALWRRVPRPLVDRPKQGFEPPIGLWLRGALRDWADDLLAPARLRAEGLLAADVVAARWREHRSGRRSWAYPLWNVLMLEAWLAAGGRAGG